MKKLFPFLLVTVGVILFLFFGYAYLDFKAVHPLVMPIFIESTLPCLFLLFWE